MSEATLAALRAAVKRGRTAVAVVSQAEGSTPRERGAWLIVTREGLCGTIGGGEAERRTVEAARALLASGAPSAALDLPLGPALDQCCGGHMRVDLARIDVPPDAPFALVDGGSLIADPPRRPVWVYGAGHVGAALVTALAPLPFRLVWLDARAEDQWTAPAAVPCRRVALPEAEATTAADEAFHIVMTHSHALDLEIVAAVLQRRFGFLGLIGSATKRATFARRLAERALDSSRLTCPIGLAIPGKEPAVIAASVAAQLVALDRAR